MFIEKMYNSESQESLSQRILCEVCLFWFHFVFAFQYLDCSYNEYPVKQTASESCL